MEGLLILNKEMATRKINLHSNIRIFSASCVKSAVAGLGCRWDHRDMVGSSQDWGAAVDGDRLLRRDRAGRQEWDFSFM